MGFPCGSAGKESACNAGDLGSTPGLGRSPGEGKGYSPQYSGMENSMDCIVHRVTKSWTQQLSLLLSCMFTEHCVVVAVYSLSHARPFATPWTIACQGPLSVRFSWQEYWSGLSFFSPGDLPNPAIEVTSPVWQVDSLPLGHQQQFCRSVVSDSL